MCIIKYSIYKERRTTNSTQKTENPMKTKSTNYLVMTLVSAAMVTACGNELATNTPSPTPQPGNGEANPGPSASPSVSPDESVFLCSKAGLPFNAANSAELVTGSAHQQSSRRSSATI